METVENSEGRQSCTDSGFQVIATQGATLKNSFSSRSVNSSGDRSEDDGPPEAQSSQFELDRDQRNGVDFVFLSPLEEAEPKSFTPGEEDPKPLSQSCDADTMIADSEPALHAEKPEPEPPSAASSSEHHHLPRIVKHKPSSITFWDCGLTSGAESGPFVNESSDECSAGDEREDDNPDCGDVFEELPEGRGPPVSQRSRDRQRRRGTSSASAGRSCGYEAEGESSSKEVTRQFRVLCVHHLRS